MAKVNVQPRFSRLADADGGTGRDYKSYFRGLEKVNQGRQTIWVPAAAMWKSTGAAGPSSAQFAITSFNGIYLAYDAATQEDAFCLVAMPKSWDLGQISAQFYWFHGAAVTNFTVAWELFANSYKDHTAIVGVGYNGAGASLFDTGGTANTLYISPESDPFTVGSSPTSGDLVHFVVRREGNNAADTLAVDALLFGIKIFYNTDAATDD